jgi:catechol 2,3-dioxygenase-like lactoylglutathione lyase family enzyme
MMKIRACAVIVLLLISATTLMAQSPGDNPLGLKPHHITASVIDLDRAIKWYEEMLGFKVTQRGERGTLKFAEMGIPGYGVGLMQLNNPSPADAAVPVKPAWVHPVFSTPDPDKAYKFLKEKGAKVNARGAKEGAPVRGFLVYDSEGNEIEFTAEAPAPK